MRHRGEDGALLRFDLRNLLQQLMQLLHLALRDLLQPPQTSSDLLRVRQRVGHAQRGRAQPRGRKHLAQLSNGFLDSLPRFRIRDHDAAGAAVSIR